MIVIPRGVGDGVGAGVGAVGKLGVAVAVGVVAKSGVVTMIGVGMGAVGCGTMTAPSTMGSCKISVGVWM